MPITVTLTFQTIDAALRALREVPESCLTDAPALEAPAPAPKPAKKSAPAAAPADAPVQPTAPPVEAPAPVAAPVAAPEPAAPGTSQVAYADLQKAVLALYKIDKAKAAAIAQGMGFESFKVMPAERWAEALDLVNAELAG